MRFHTLFDSLLNALATLATSLLRNLYLLSNLSPSDYSWFAFSIYFLRESHHNSGI